MIYLEIWQSFWTLQNRRTEEALTCSEIGVHDAADWTSFPSFQKQAQIEHCFPVHHNAKSTTKSCHHAALEMTGSKKEETYKNMKDNTRTAPQPMI